mmetsp:Transcript_22406/g.24931  ORF Transcript_22406/g.24931 Transcript_22406/m.24931 type:complete len:411 (+) Transcript_22406:23-1255(+)
MAESKCEMPPDSVSVTCTAPVNIAVIKYWGKRDTTLILPINSSLSATIHQDTMRSRTTIVASKSFQSDSMALNNEEVAMGTRLQTVIRALRARAQDLVDESGTVLVPKADWPLYKLRIVSDNNFPTAAGLASSASGLACFTSCLAALFQFEERFKGELSGVARQGSGSASRSMYGGFVKWIKGERADGTDSIAKQVATVQDWPEMRVLICVVNGAKKKIGSTQGMQLGVKTSPLLKFRAENVVEPRMREMERAIRTKDFPAFAKLSMQDSNQFHATCLDTYPPIFYMNDTSKRIVNAIHELNAAAGVPLAGYTFDAGPNAVIYTLEKYMSTVMALLLHYFQPREANLRTFVQDNLHLWANQPGDEPLLAAAKKSMGPRLPGDSVRTVIVSKPGPGPIIVDRSQSFTRSKL